MMVDTHQLYNKLKERFTEEQADALVGVLSGALSEVAQFATKQDILELRDVVRELAEAQKRTEERLNELAEAQKRTEERLNQTEKRVDDIDERLNQLTIRVNELAEAQKRTEQRLNELAEIVKGLVEEMKDVKQQLGGLAMAVGYGIEDRAMPYFYDLAKKDYGITLYSVDRRNYVYPDGRYDEINIYAEGKRGKKPYLIIAECKAQPSKRDADRFSGLLNRLKQHTSATIYPILIGYIFSPDVEYYIQSTYPEIRMMKTFEFEMNYRLFKSKYPRRIKPSVKR